MSAGGCPSRSSTGVRCDRPAGHVARGDRMHVNEVAGVEWIERRPRPGSPTEELVHLDELVGWRGQAELPLGGTGEIEVHAQPTRARR